MNGTSKLTTGEQLAINAALSQLRNDTAEKLRRLLGLAALVRVNTYTLEEYLDDEQYANMLLYFGPEGDSNRPYAYAVAMKVVLSSGSWSVRVTNKTRPARVSWRKESLVAAVRLAEAHSPGAVDDELEEKLEEEGTTTALVALVAHRLADDTAHGAGAIDVRHKVDFGAIRDRAEALSEDYAGQAKGFLAARFFAIAIRNQLDGLSGRHWGTYDRVATQLERVSKVLGNVHLERDAMDYVDWDKLAAIVPGIVAGLSVAPAQCRVAGALAA